MESLQNTLLQCGFSVSASPDRTPMHSSYSSDPSPSWREGRSRLLILSGLALLAFLLRVYRLDYQSLWRDEVDAVIFATREVGAILATFATVGENGSLYFLGLHFWIDLFGRSEFAIRFPSVVFGVLAVLATYHLGREVVGRSVGVIGACLLAVSPYHVWYGQEAKMYAVISFLAPLSLLLLLRALRGGARWLWLAWAGLMGVFLYVHLFATMMVLVAATWTPLLLRRRPRLTPVLVVTLALTLAALPVARWLLPAALTPVETGYFRYGLGEMATILLYNFSMGLRPAAGLWPAIVFVLLFVAGCAPLVLTVKHDGTHETACEWPQARGVLLLVLYLLAPLLAIWLVSLRRPTFTDRYLIITLPAFYLLIAAGIVAIARVCEQALTGAGHAPASRASMPVHRAARLKRVVAVRVGRQEEVAASVAPARLPAEAAIRPARDRMLGAWVALGLALVVSGVSLPFVWAQTHDVDKADFRAATRYVTERAAADDLIIFLMPYVQRGFAYYHPQPVRSAEPPYTRGMTAAQVDEKMRGLTAGSSTVWLFLSEQDFWDPDGLIPAWFERNTVRRCQAQFTYIDVRCYAMK